MEYQKIANLIDLDASSEPSKFGTKNWVETNDESRGTCNVKFKSSLKLLFENLSYAIIVMHISLLREK